MHDTCCIEPSVVCVIMCRISTGMQVALRLSARPLLRVLDVQSASPVLIKTNPASVHVGTRVIALQLAVWPGFGKRRG